MTAPRGRETQEQTWTVDECEDAAGNFTVRVADGTPNGDTSEQPIASVYHYENAKLIALSPELLAFAERVADGIGGECPPDCDEENLCAACAVSTEASALLARVRGEIGGAK